MSTCDLSPSERRFLDAMTEVGFGRIEALRIEQGELVLDPWPTTIRSVKFGSADVPLNSPISEHFELKKQVAEFFEYVRATCAGEIRCLELRHGMPLLMDVELQKRGGRG
jgi:hypothetical protein